MIGLAAYNPLQYPYGRPAGVDWSHPASNALVFSAVPAGTLPNYVNLMDGSVGTNNAGSNPSAPTMKFDNVMGPTPTWGGIRTNTTNFTFANQPTGTLSRKITMAAIVSITSAAQLNTIVLGAGENTGAKNYRIFCNTVPNWRLDVAGINSYTFNGFASAVGKYFLAMSADTAAGNAAIVQVNLVNGKVNTQTITGTVLTGNAPTAGITVIAGDLPNSSAWVGGISACMFNYRFMSLPVLLKWAADPWAFWYPPKRHILMFSSLATAAARRAVNRGLVMG
jgi:hypothetical protein